MDVLGYLTQRAQRFFAKSAEDKHGYLMQRAWLSHAKMRKDFSQRAAEGRAWLSNATNMAISRKERKDFSQRSQRTSLAIIRKNPQRILVNCR